MAANPSDDTAELLEQFKNLASAAEMINQFKELAKIAQQRAAQVQDFRAMVEQERQKFEEADKEREKERQKREKADKERERAIEELHQQRLRAQHAEQRAANYEEHLKKFQFDDMPTSIINPQSFKMPKRDQINEELRHLAIGESVILTLGQNLPINAQQALMKEFVVRKNVSNFESALAWLTLLKTQHIDWNNFEEWLELFCLNGPEHMS